MTTAAPAIAADPLVARLRSDAAKNVGGGLALVIVGVLASVLTVVLIVLLIGATVGWFGLFFYAWVGLVGVLFAGAAVAWLRVRPGLLAGRAFEYVDPRAEWMGIGRYEGATAVLGMAADALLIGPRILEAGAKQAGDREPASRERFFDHCALLLRQLAKAGEQVKADAVRIGDDETDAKLRPVLDYLDRGGWLGLSSDRTRLWLSTRAKTDLPRLGVPIGVAGQNDAATRR